MIHKLFRQKRNDSYFLFSKKVKHGGIRTGLFLLKTPLLYLPVLPNSHPFPLLFIEQSDMHHCINRNVCDRSQRKKFLFNHKQFCD